MKKLVTKYLNPASPTKIYDLGSYDINGSYRELFERTGWSYCGIDLEPGPNVDIVLNSPYKISLSSKSADLIVSGQAFEHIEYFWLTWLELVRLLKPGGMIFLIVPSRGPEHRHPVDCWRFYPDGYCALARYAGLDLLEVHTDWSPVDDTESAVWGDTVGVFRRRNLTRLQDFKYKLLHMIARILPPPPEK